MLPSGQRWLLTRFRSSLNGLCTGASYTKVDYNFQHGDSKLYYALLEKINSIPENDPIFDVIKNYLEERRQAFINAKAKLLREMKPINRTDIADKTNFYRRLRSKVSQELPFPFTEPVHGLTVESLHELADIIDKIYLHQASNTIREALLLPRNKKRDIHQEIMYLFNPELVGQTKQVASYAHVLPAQELSTFFSTLTEALEEAKISSHDNVSICFFDQTHMINIRFSPDKGWELANINRGKARYYNDQQIGKNIIDSLPDSRQGSQILFSCHFYAPTEQAKKVANCLGIWRQNLARQRSSLSTYETANFKVIDCGRRTLSWLGMAVKAKDIEQVIELLCHIDNWGEYNHLFPAILHLAIRENKIDFVIKLLEKGVSVKCIYEGRNPFHLAAAYGQNDILALLIDEVRGVDLSNIINQYDEDGYTPLAIAVEEGKDGVVQQLLAYKEVLPNMPCKNLKTPLSIAVENKDLDMVSILLGSGADPNITYDNRGRTPLHLAVIAQDITLVKMLLDYGAIIQSGVYSSSDKMLSTLELANHTGNKAIVALLTSRVDASASISPPNLGTMNFLTPTFAENKPLRLQPLKKKKTQKKESAPQNEEQILAAKLSQEEQLNQRRAKHKARSSSYRLIGIIEQLTDNISQQKNGRETVRYSDWKTDLLQSISDRLKEETELTEEARQRYIQEIREVCASRRNFFHFWAEPHSVGEFESLLNEEPISAGVAFN